MNAGSLLLAPRVLCLVKALLITTRHASALVHVSLLGGVYVN
jgi:hypothetical protein